MMFKRCIHQTLRQLVRTPSFKAGNTGKNLSLLDILGDLKLPQNNIEMINDDSIIFSNLTVIKSPNDMGDIMGSVLINDMIYQINLTKSGYKCHNNFIIELDETNPIFELINLIHPKPDMLIIGLGKNTKLLHQSTKDKFNKLGVQLDINNTQNAAQNFNLLATERSLIAGLLFPPNV